ncbi:monovalent cation/H+ antiporter complex subunit F [Luteimonas abyssi]|uniref:monovalent cation/H+ antiporter complex subunit F n=1 Tax=Luteimonas abyssi TaxID=1247514 RepID=UPI000737CA73|nr:monovalent cation/H+ antiporter complex subunit F [Luteimonas abyssi]
MGDSTLAVSIIVGAALLALLLAFVRLLRGPAQADRVVALDVVFSSSIAMAAGAALASGRALFLDVAIGLAVVGFVATIVWARLIEASPREES